MSYWSLTVKQQHALQNEWWRVAKEQKEYYGDYYAKFEHMNWETLEDIEEMRPHEQFQNLAEQYIYKMNHNPHNVRWFKGNRCL